MGIMEDKGKRKIYGEWEVDRKLNEVSAGRERDDREDSLWGDSGVYATCSIHRDG